MVIRGGENIYPREARRILYRIRLFRTSRCSALPDTKYGEESVVIIGTTGAPRRGECPQVVRIGFRQQIHATSAS